MKKIPVLITTILLGFACWLAATESIPATTPNDNSASTAKASIPRLVDLGAEKCIPCKMMKPILDELTENYADQFEVVFIDVWKNREAGSSYGIRMIPTQIFFDATGKELSRHEGFMAKKDILAMWKKHGITINDPSPQSE